MEMSYTIRRIRRPQIRKIGTKAHLQINDRNASGADGGQNGCNRANGLPDWCNIEPQVVDYATLCSEVVLHVDDNQRSLGKIDLNWFRFGVQLDAATLDAFRGRRPISWLAG